MRCTICSEPASHYYRSAGGENVGRCPYHADQFGYPEYLVELKPACPALRTPAFLIQTLDGSGHEFSATDAIWPWDDDLAVFVAHGVAECTDQQAEWLVADAAYAPYEPQYLETAHATVEVTRVTSLSVLQH